MGQSNPNLVVKSNNLVNARLNGLTLTQIRFLEILIAQLDRNQSDFAKQRIYLSDFAKVVGTSNRSEYQRAREATKAMMQHVIEILDDEGLKQRNIFHLVDYPKGKSYVEVVFHPHLRPYLLQLKEKFTSYDIRNVLPLNSVYAIQIYQLLKQYLNIGRREFELQDLKQILGVENKYKLYGDFKKRVLVISQREISNNCDIDFVFKEKKRGKKVHSIVFHIFLKKEKLLLDTPKSTASTQVRNTKSSGSRENEQIVIKSWLDEFEAIWKRKETEAKAKLDDEKLNEFEEYVKCNLGMRTILIKNGRIDTANNLYEVFLGDFLCPRQDDEFERFVLEKKGYKLARDENSETSYKIITDQKQLF